MPNCEFTQFSCCSYASLTGWQAPELVTSKHSVMWKLLSVEVRGNMEIQFRKLRAWLDMKKRNPLDMMMEYRRIVCEEAWITSEDGDLHVHFHNWNRRKPK